MSPFTGLLENMSHKLPAAGGVFINAESEIEGVNMAIGAAATGARAATGSCGQGIALMQEAIAEAALNETPMVVFNMARNQQDYFQCTRGGGWGDYRTITLAPKDVPEAVEHTQRLFHLADKYRAPVILYGDPLIAQTRVGVDVQRLDFGAAAAEGLGARRHRRRHRPVAPGLDLGDGQGHRSGAGPRPALAGRRREVPDRSPTPSSCTSSPMWTMPRRSWWRSASAAKFVEYVVRELRAEGHTVGWFRPVTLWPFPGAALDRGDPAARDGCWCSSSTPARCSTTSACTRPTGRRRAVHRRREHRRVRAWRTGELLDAPVIRDAASSRRRRPSA